MSSAARERTVAIIPARYASQRLPGKPLADIGGQPMIRRVYERAAAASRIDQVVVATDDARIVEAVHAFGGSAVMTDAALASGTDRIAAVALTMPEAAIVVNVQGDEPLIDPAMIDEAVAPLQEDPTLEAGTVVRRIGTQEELLSPSVPKVVLDGAGFCLYFSRSPVPHVRDLPVARWLDAAPFYAHVGLYVFRRQFLLQYASWPPTPLEQAERLEQLRILEHGRRIRAVVTTCSSIPVDTLDDLERVRTLVKGPWTT